MKSLFLVLLTLASYFSYGQACTGADTATGNNVTLITATSARVNANVDNSGPGSGFHIGCYLVYVRVGYTDTVTVSTPSITNGLVNLTGLSAGTAYRYYYRTVCTSNTVNQVGAYIFTTLGSAIVYKPEYQPYQWGYGKFDSSLAIPNGDTSIGRAPPTLPQLKYKTSNNTFYGYYPSCLCWRPLAIDSAGIIGLLNDKVDSVTVSGDSLFYWKVGVAYGYILPTADNFDATVDFSVNYDPNDPGTTFSPNTPQLTTKIYVSTIDGSQWTWSGVDYKLYTSVAWRIFGNSGLAADASFLGTTDSVDLVIKTKGIERARFNARGALGLGNGTDYGTSGYVLQTNGNGTSPTWVINNNNFDATVDFSVNADPNTGGTTFNPNTPQLTTKIYVSTIDGSQWTWNSTAYVIYTSIGWNTFGNAGTTSGNFIGTTDNVPLNFRVNNTTAGFINHLTYNTAFGFQTLPYHITGGQNTAIGYNTMNNDTSGASNTAIGFSAMQLNLSGATNTAIGGESLYSNTTGIGNIAIGNQAGFENTTESNQLYISNQSYGGYALDTAKSIIYGEMSSSPANQRIRLNSRIYAPYISSAVGDKSVRYNTTTKELTYADTTAGGGGSGITVGTTTITSGTNTRVGYNNAGVYGEYPITGTGNVMLSASPTTTGTLTAAAVTASGIITASAGVGLPFGSGTNKDTKIATYDIGVSNYAGVVFSPLTGTNVGEAFAVSPKGTGFSSTNMAQFAVYNTDVIADATNTEFFGMRAIGSSGYVIGSGKTGTGGNRDMMFAAGWFTNGTTNANQLLLSANGNVGINNASPAASAILDISSTTQGVLFSRMTTTQKNAISSPAEGLVVYDTTLHKLCVYTGSAWETVTSL